MVRTVKRVTRSRQIWGRSWGRLLGFLRQHAEGLAVSILSLGFFGLLMLLAATVSRSATEPTAMLSWDSRQAFISGPFSCLPSESFELQVTVSQHSSGIEGSGLLSSPCMGGVQRWTAAVTAAAGTSFLPGPARACTAATIHHEGRTIGETQWCRDIILHHQEGSE